MNKKFLLKLFVGFILIVFIVIYLIFSVYKLLVFNKIAKQVESYLAQGNYTLDIIAKQNDQEVLNTSAHYRNGIGKLVFSNGNYTWVENDTAYLVDETNKIMYTIDLTKQLNAIQFVQNDYLSHNIAGYYSSLGERIKASFNPGIVVVSKKYNDTKCYKITSGTSGNLKTSYISKDKCIPVYTELETSDSGLIKYEYTLSLNSNKIAYMQAPSTKVYQVSDKFNQENTTETETDSTSQENDLNSVTDMIMNVVN